MIRSAISDEPLLTTKERVKRAISLITKGKKLSAQENKWISSISNHLESNLLIEKQHFKTIPFSTK